MSEIIAKTLEGEEIKLKVEDGYLIDCLTGGQIKDSLEERIVQALISFLLDNRGYRPGEIKRKKRWRIQIGRNRTAAVEADIVIELNGFSIILIEAKAPGIPLDQFKAQALSYAKLHSPPIPIVVLTNDPPQLGSTWIYNTFTEKLIADTLTAIPTRAEAFKLVRKRPPQLTNQQIQEAKQRLLTFIDVKEFARVFDRCHNMIRTQKGMDARQRLFEMCKIILIKFHEEKRLRKGEEYRFSISAMEDAERRLGINATEFYE